MSGDGHGGGGGGGGHDDDEHEEHEEHVNHEAWVIPYADLLTLLMAMFIALFAISNVDAQKFKKLAEGFSDALNAGGGSSATVVDLGGSGEKLFISPMEAMVSDAAGAMEKAAVAKADPSSEEAAEIALSTVGSAVADAQAAAEAELEGLQEAISSQAAAAGFGGNLETSIDARGLVITVVTDEVVFGSGSAEFGAGGSSILAVVGQALAAVDNEIRVEGHTDDIPISTATFPSNWELSTARAGAVVRFFMSANGGAIPTGRLTAAGFADTHPLDTNETEAGRARNRRVEVIVESDINEKRDQILDGVVQASDRLNRNDAAQS
ncbi:MAG: OmpA family protein [Acidimicrobiales bacterium]|nr:OmpA family protein [Acidimicrobiales bacterium]